MSITPVVADTKWTWALSGSDIIYVSSVGVGGAAGPVGPPGPGVPPGGAAFTVLQKATPTNYDTQWFDLFGTANTWTKSQTIQSNQDPLLALTYTGLNISARLFTISLSGFGDQFWVDAQGDISSAGGDLSLYHPTAPLLTESVSLQADGTAAILWNQRTGGYKFKNSGAVVVLSVTDTGSMTVQVTDVNVPVAVFKGANGQVGNSWEARDFTNAVVASVNAVGGLTVSGNGGTSAAPAIKINNTTLIQPAIKWTGLSSQEGLAFYSNNTKIAAFQDNGSFRFSSMLSWGAEIGLQDGVGFFRGGSDGPRMFLGSTASPLARFSENNGTAFSTVIQADIPNINTIGISVKAKAGQTAPLQEWQDSLGTMVARVRYGGSGSNGLVSVANSGSERLILYGGDDAPNGRMVVDSAGCMVWSNNSDVTTAASRDTGIGRNSAGVAKITLGNAGGIGSLVINQLWTNSSAAGTVLGSVVKKWAVYDQTGALLGYVPLYNSIT